MALLRADSPLYLLIILIGVSFLYFPTLKEPFHGDDFVAFTEFKTKSFSHYVKDVMVFKDTDFYWRPLGKILHRALFEGFGFNATPFRVAGLVVFLATLWCLYSFCIREKLGPYVALGATAFFGFMPNHVVSVAWVTNTSRLMAVLFFMLCMLLLQRTKDKRSYLFEGAAWLLFIAAALSDETALALAPIPVLYAVFIHDERIYWRSAAVRAIAYAVLVAGLVPLQFAENLNDEPRLAYYGFSLHMLPEFWTLVSQLVLPITPPAPFDILIESIKPLQWAAGAAALIAGGVLLIIGSKPLRFLVAWTALAIAPFTLWDLSYLSPRYVYIATVPYSIIVAWAAVALVGRAQEAARSLDLTHVTPRLFKDADFNHLALSVLVRGGVAGGLGVLLVVAGGAVRDRNNSWGHEAQKYGVLANSFERQLPRVPKGSRIVIFDQDLPDFWATSVAQAISGDRTLRVVDIPSDKMDAPRPPFGNKDVLFYFSGGELVPSNLSTAR